MFYGSLIYFGLSIVLSMMIGGTDTVGTLITRSLIFAFIFAAFYEYSQKKQQAEKDRRRARLEILSDDVTE